MADKLHFSLVSPERALVSKDVDSVDIPGAEGWIGILPNHAPFMTVLAPGVVVLKNGSEEERIFVRGGFAEVTPDGLTVLAEEAIPVAELSSGDITERLKNAKVDLENAGDNVEKLMTAQQSIDRLQELQTTL